MNAQLVLPLDPCESFRREAFVVGPSNQKALAFLDSWPALRIPAAAIYGPAGSGKTHLVSIWGEMSGASSTSCRNLASQGIPAVPLAIEDVDAGSRSVADELALFHLLEHASIASPVLLTGREAPRAWESSLPDLRSRFSAIPAVAIEPPDDPLLAAIARKLFADRQLAVPEAAIARMLHTLERSPAAIRAFVAQADRKALAESRAITPALIGELLAFREQRLS